MDTKNGSVVFGQTNVFGKKDFLALRKDNDDKIVFYKTFYYGNKIPKKFQKIELEDIKKEISVEGGRSSINHLDNQDSAASISARTDTSNIQHNGDEVNSQTYLSGENSESSKLQKYAETIDNSQKENQIHEEQPKTIIQEFATITQQGLKTYANIVVDNYEEHTKPYLLKSQDGQETVQITEKIQKYL